MFVHLLALLAANPLTPGPVIPITSSANVVNSVLVSGSASMGFMATYGINTLGGPPLLSQQSTDNGATWGLANTISSSLDADPLVWVTATDTGFIASWTVPGRITIGSTVYANNFTSGAWNSSPTNLSGSAIVVSGNLAVVNGTGTDFMTTWTDALGMGGFSAFTPNGGAAWTSSLSITSASAVTTPTMNAKNRDGFVAVWSSGMNGYASFSADNGVTWNGPFPITDTSDVVQDVCISSNGKGFMATWGNTSSVANAAFSNDNGTTWTQSPAGIATNIAPIFNVSVSGTTSGFVATWLDQITNSIFASFSSDNGQSWSTPVLISGFSIPQPVNPVAFIGVSAVDNGCMFTWLDQFNNAQSCFTTITAPPTSSKKSSTLFKQLYPNKLGNGLYSL